MQKEQKTLAYSELFTDADSNGRILTKVEINIGSGNGNRARTYAPKALANDLILRGYSIEQLKEKRITAFINGTMHMLTGVVS